MTKSLFKITRRSINPKQWLVFVLAAGVCSLFAQSKPPFLMPGLGQHHHTISTTSPEAQRFFDQGLTLVFGYNPDEAALSFGRAAQLDPKAAMPWWGLALAYGPNLNTVLDAPHAKMAHEAIEKARTLAASGPAYELACIETLAARFPGVTETDLNKPAYEYTKAIRRLTQRYPDDLDTATLYAESLMELALLNRKDGWLFWKPDGTPGEHTLEIVSTLESVLARDPNHVGANHFYIHVVESSPSPAHALPSANRLRTLVPAIGHLVHMPSHIDARIGDYSSAAKANELAVQADAVYLRESTLPDAYAATYNRHNLHALGFAAAMAGNFAQAHHAAEELANTFLTHPPPHPGMSTTSDASYVPLMLLRFHQWHDLLSTPVPEAAEPALLALWRFSRAMSFAAVGKPSQAKLEQRQFELAVQQVPADEEFGYNSTAKILHLAGTMLEAQLAAAHGDPSQAIEMWKRAVALQDGLSYNEPPDWYYPVRESLGGELLRAGRYIEAERVFREDLQRNPRNGWSLFGLWRSLQGQSRTVEAQWVRQQFEEAWKAADVDLADNSL